MTEHMNKLMFLVKIFQIIKLPFFNFHFFQSVNPF